jgi:hypothetical protein
MPETEHKKKKDFEPKVPTFKVPWSRLSQEEKDEIIEKAKIRKEEEDRKKNQRLADIILGRQRTQDTAWD